MQVKLVFCYYISTFSKQEDYMLIQFKHNLLILPLFKHRNLCDCHNSSYLCEQKNNR